MRVDPEKLECLKQRVAATFMCNPNTPSDFDLLATDVFQRTGRTISVSTLKRIWAYIPSSHGTSFSSLTVLCRYVGYHDWEVFCERVGSSDRFLSETSGFGTDNIIACHTLELNTELRLRWLPDKECILRKIDQPDLFRVEHSVNIKLLPGDTGHLNSVQIGIPLMMVGCRRGTEVIGAYRGASRSGLEAAEIID